MVIALMVALMHDPRTLRKPLERRPFAVTLRHDETAPAVAECYRLVIDGRVLTFSHGGAIRSQADRATTRIAAAEIHRLAIEAGGKLLKG
jgi:hypothetical protein